MCRTVLLLIALLPITLLAQEERKPISPVAALKMIDQRVTVQMEVKSTGGNTARYLNSEGDYRSETNFAIFIPQAALSKFQKADIADPGVFYKGKTIQATGTVVASTSKAALGRPQIRVDDPAQIKVVEQRSVVDRRSKPKR